MTTVTTLLNARPAIPAIPEPTKPILPGLSFHDVTPADHDELAAMMGRGMRDNPIHVAVFGDDPEIRRQGLETMFRGALRLGMGWQLTVTRQPGGAIVGVCGKVAPGACQPTGTKKVAMLPPVFANGFGAGLRTLRWLGAWSKHDPAERHWHLGPVAVDADYQGLGVGSALLARFCAEMDAAGEVAYLETDKAINVRFYARFGFETVGEATILDTPNWFMRRAPRPVR